MVRKWLAAWPVYRRFTGRDRSGRRDAAKSRRTAELQSRSRTADRVVKSICPSTLTAAALTLAGTAACSSSPATHSANTTRTSPPAVAKGDRAWLAAAHQANLAEIQAGELAQKKGGTPAVRAAGRMLVTDHTVSDRQVTRVADGLKVTLPASAAPVDAATASRLGNEFGAQFDHDFLAAMETGHQKVIALTQTEIAHGTVPQIKSLAVTTLPVLRKHLNTLRKAASTS